MISDMLPELDLYYSTDRAQYLMTAGDDLDYLDRDLSDLFCPTCCILSRS